MGAPEAAGGPYSQPGAGRRNTGHPGANGWQSTPNGHCRGKSRDLKRHFFLAVSRFRKDFTLLHLIGWSGRVVRVVTLGAWAFGMIGHRAHVINGSVCSGIEAGFSTCDSEC